MTRLFKDFITLQRGFDLPKTEMQDGPYPVVGSTSIIGHHNEFKVKPPGVVMGRSGSLGTIQLIKAPFWPHNTSLWVKDFKGNDPQFVYYRLQGFDFARFNAGAGVPTLNRNHLDGLEVEVPPLPAQRRIAGILSAYDDLIENSQRRIKILEETARSLYREWFVHFRFPGHDKAKRAPSYLGPIPQGWKLVTLKEVTSKIGSGATPRGGKESYKTEGIRLIRSLNVYDYRFDLSGLAFIDETQASELNNVAVVPRDILLNITGASVARCCMVPSYVLPARVNQHVAIVRTDPSQADPHYVFDTINSDQKKQELLGLAQGGATREALTKDTIGNFPIILPPRPLLDRYGKFSGALHAQREALESQTQNLRRTRDLLLPRLLSGQTIPQGTDL